MKVCNCTIPGLNFLDVSLDKKDVLITTIALAALALLATGSVFLGLGVSPYAAYYLIGVGGGLLLLDVLAAVIKITRAKNLSVPPPFNYPGHLTDQEKSKIETTKIEDCLNISFKDNPSFSVNIRNQDILESDVEVIVNAANPIPDVHAFGVNAFIHDKAGERYTQAHEALPNPLIEGYTYVLDSYDLKDSHEIEKIIVVVGPVVNANPKAIANSQLYSCYLSSLIEAHNNNFKSIAFPAISTGVFGFDKNEAARISLRAIYEFITMYPESSLAQISIHFIKDPECDNLEVYSQALNPDDAPNTNNAAIGVDAVDMHTGRGGANT